MGGTGETPGTDRAATGSVAAMPRGATAAAAVGAHPDPLALLHQWLVGIKIAHVGHTRAATIYARRNRWLGGLATLASAVVGTTLFTSLSTSDKGTIVTFAAIVSVATVVLTALSTFLNYADLVTGHRAAASTYGALRRRVEQLVVFGEPDKLRDEMTDIAATWSKIEQDAVDLPPGMYDYGYRWVHSRNRTGLLGNE